MTGVSRETVDATVVESLFPDRDAAEKIHRYVDILLSDGVTRGVLGPREAGRIWSRHILNCAVVAPALPPYATVCDVGSGAGLPGIVLALARPDVVMTLLEPQLRRVRFLQDVRRALSLPDLVVERGRAPDDAPAASWDVVVARAVAPLDRLLESTLPLCAAGGTVLAWKGDSAERERAAAMPVLRAWDAQSVTVERYGHDVVTPPAVVVRVGRPSGGSTAATRSMTMQRQREQGRDAD